MLLRLPPPVALAYEWALPIAGDRATAALEEFAKLGGQPATWLSRFRHRPPPLFRGEGSDALWVLVAEFADSYRAPDSAVAIRAGGRPVERRRPIRLPVLPQCGRRFP